MPLPTVFFFQCSIQFGFCWRAIYHGFDRTTAKNNALLRQESSVGVMGHHQYQFLLVPQQTQRLFLKSVYRPVLDLCENQFKVLTEASGHDILVSES